MKDSLGVRINDGGVEKSRKRGKLGFVKSCRRHEGNLEKPNIHPSDK
jgi:hypothetical protein